MYPIQKTGKKFYKFGLIIFVCLGFILVALQNPDTSEVSKKDTSRTVKSAKVKKNLISEEADSLLVQCNIQIKQGAFQDALLSADKSLKLNQKIENHRSVGNCYNKIATIYYYQGDFQNALTYFEEGIDSYNKVDFQSGVATLINNIGAIYYYLGNFPKALEQYKKAASLNASLNNQMQSATTTQNIGGIYLELDQHDQAMKHFHIAKKTYQELRDTLSLSQINNSIGDVYLSKHSYKLALDSFEEALQLAKSIDAQQSILEVLYNLGDIYQTLEAYDSAMNYYSKAIELSDNLSNKLYQSLSKIGVGSTFLDIGQVNKAIYYCQNGMDIALEIKTISVQKDACDCLYSAYKSSKKSKLALGYLEKSLLLKDSMQSRQTADKILNMEFEKKMLLDSISDREKEKRIELAHQEILRDREKQRNIIIIALVFIVIVAIAIWSRLNYVRKSKKRLQKEKDRSEHLLLNILPEEIADELKTKGFVDAQDFTTASILFTDFKSFTATASKLNSQDLVQELNACFKAFDYIIERYKIEKIKTIGDAYMAAGGVPIPDTNAVKNTILAALEMQEFIMDRKIENDLLGKPSFEMRVGIHSGPIVAGIVGIKKFQYDIWGDTVNTASRMESNGEIGCVNISRNTYLLVREDKNLVFESRGKINAKGKGDIEMYFVSRSNQSTSFSENDTVSLFQISDL